MSRPSRPAPPPPSRPGHVQVVRALYNYNAQQEDELSFQEGDILYIIDKNNPSGWWRAKVGSKEGMIPSNYVEESTESVDHPMHEAAKRGNLGFLKECILNKVSPNSLDKSGSTALHWAASGGHFDCAAQLLNLPHVDVNVQNKLGDTALHNASWKGHASVVEILLDRGANKNIQNNEKKKPYDLARNPQVAMLLKDKVAATANDYGEDEDSD
ncbi:osteoclast-stimulating factor 1-like isoform X2 [Rhopilema esculentum]|uniref:osteoclast-stimulating factor 1-like isoform X2 n=1 Tax=Rhopilema esculentum TaxID=499914 RepID=UPI0031DE3E6B